MMASGLVESGEQGEIDQQVREEMESSLIVTCSYFTQRCVCKSICPRGCEHLHILWTHIRNMAVLVCVFVCVCQRLFLCKSACVYIQAIRQTLTETLHHSCWQLQQRRFHHGERMRMRWAQKISIVGGAWLLQYVSENRRDKKWHGESYRNS